MKIDYDNKNVLILGFGVTGKEVLKTLLGKNCNNIYIYDSNKGDFEDRYEYDDLDSEGLNQELVVVDGQLLDGYNRASVLLNRGDDYAEAYVALPKK